MKDSAADENNAKNKFAKMNDSPLLTFSRPYLDFIGKGKFFNLIYIVMAVLNPIIPFVILYTVIDSGFLSLGAKYVFAFILMWFVIFFACWVGFQLWWNRRKNVMEIESTEFFATMAFAEIMQTFGEWLGTLIAIIGAGGGLLASIFLGKDVDYLFSMVGMGFMRFGVLAVIVAPITGFFIILLSRFAAEQVRLRAALVSNTGEIAAGIKGKR